MTSRSWQKLGDKAHSVATLLFAFLILPLDLINGLMKLESNKYILLKGYTYMVLRCIRVWKLANYKQTLLDTCCIAPTTLDE